MKGSKGKKVYDVLGLIVLVIIYMCASLATTIVARDSGSISVMGGELRIAQFAGIISSFANIILIFMVISFKKPGFVAALITLLGQFPMITITIFRVHNLGSIPGFFNNIFTIVAVIIIYQRSKKIDRYQEAEIEHLQEQQKLSKRLFEQTATALVNSIDAKDTYSHGHSLRVAEYSAEIARKMGKTDEEVEKIYYAALLHDVGKIGIDDSIINKNGRLTKEEYEVIKQHPVFGNQILSSISEYPYLSIGAHYHHERYDGKGYPEGLKGDDIPEIARIISVADSYDAMTSTRSYRHALPQQLVREEIIKGAGNQFDPEIARIMQRMIDEDQEYKLRERRTVKEFAGKSDLECVEFKKDVSGSVLLTPEITKLDLKINAIDKKKPAVALILFDASDGNVHNTEDAIREMSYFEYAVIWSDGRVDNVNAREIKNTVKESRGSVRTGGLRMTGVKYHDHVMLTIDDGKELRELIIALPDSARFVYCAISGENCIISDTEISRDNTPIGEGYIPRIAPEISYIEGEAGNIPNVQINFYRTVASESIKVKDGMKLCFHSMSLPTARLVWHCPYIILFTSADGKVNGSGYKEYAFIRLDGEFWDEAEGAKNELVVKDDEFIGWNRWKEENKTGIEYEIDFECRSDRVIVSTSNLGLSIRNTTVFNEGNEQIYVAITGDQIAVTNIRIK